jgi:hypothetical protein
MSSYLHGIRRDEGACGPSPARVPSGPVSTHGWSEGSLDFAPSAFLSEDRVIVRDEAPGRSSSGWNGSLV